MTRAWRRLSARWAIVVFLAARFIPPGAALAGGGKGEAEKLLGFAGYLQQQGEYYRAITEYLRFIFLYPQDERVASVRLKIADCYLAAERWEEAKKVLEQLLSYSLPDRVRLKALYKLGQSYFSLRNYRAARRTLEVLLQDYPQEQEVQAAAWFLIGRSYLMEDKWVEASEAFGHIKLPGLEGLPEAALAGRELGYKSPGVAGLLSAALPGAGQLYLGRYQDAVVAFLLNGAFIWGAVEAFRRDNDVAGGLLVFFELGWYGGNIYSAVGSAHKYNRRLKDDFREELLSRYQVQFSSQGASVNFRF